MYGRECLLPIDFSSASSSVVDWEGEVKDREDLLIARMRQLDEPSLEIARAAKELERSRKGNKAYFDQHKRMRGDPQQLHVDDLMLCINPPSNIRVLDEIEDAAADVPSADDLEEDLGVEGD